MTGSVDLAWDSNREPDIAGYRLKYGLVSGSLSESKNTGAPVTNVTISELVPGQTYYFAVLAYNSAGIEGPLSDEISYVYPVTAEPDISVEKSSMVLVDGVDSGSLGSVAPGSTGSPQTFIIRNAGAADLTGLSITIDGTGSSDFIVSHLTTTALAPGADTSFSISFKPTGTGNRNAVVHISSNDTDENPFDIPFHGEGLTLPEISVTDSLTGDLTDGISTMNFGNVPAGTTGSPAIVTIRNSGTAPLTGIIVTSEGPNASDFLWETPGASILAPGESTEFQVWFKPSAAGTRSAVIHLTSNDSDTGPFSVMLTGSGVEIAAISLEDAGGLPVTTGEAPTPFIDVPVGSAGVPVTYTIRNIGNIDLTGIKVSTLGPDAPGFIASLPAATSLAPGASTNFTVIFKPVSAGIKTAGLQVIDSLSAGGPFENILSGMGVLVPETTPEINVRVGDTNLVDDKSIIEFGTGQVGSRGKSKTITISNVGSAKLRNISIKEGGIHRDDFSVRRMMTRSLDSGKSTSFKVAFNPYQKGSRWATLRVTSNDKDEKSFDIILTGTGSDNPVAIKRKKKSRNEAKSAAPASLTRAANPVQGVEVIKGGRYRTLTIKRSPGSEILPKGIEVSSNLVDWASGSRHTTVLRDDAGILKVRDNTPVTQDSKRHIRLSQ